MEWRYETPYTIVNVDETTTTTKLAGGYSPTSFGGEKDIQYGAISRALFKRGARINGMVGMGGNVMLDEINRTDFENISFLMGFFESPYQYTMQEDEGRLFLNPNQVPRREGKEYRWLFLGTMNIQDIGNQPLSMAFKSRFHIIRVQYTKKEMKEILEELFRLTEYEKDIFNSLYNYIQGWHQAKDVLFPAGIRHYVGFFTYLRSILRDIDWDDVDEDLVLKGTGFTLELFLKEILRSAMLMPIVNESNRQLVDEKENQIQRWATNYYEDIKTYVRANSIDDLETVIY